MARWFYTLLYFLLFPLIMLRLWQRGVRAPAYRQRWHERLAWVRASAQPTLWVHAVSVGETIAAAPMIRRLMTDYPQYRLLVTTMTPTGSARVRDLFGESVDHVYAPYDLPLFLSLFIRRKQPVALIIMETELWPNMIHAMARRGLPVMLANARLSERSARGYGRVRFLASPMVKELTWIAAQGDADARRFLALGVASDRIAVTGTIKFDVDVSDELREKALVLRDRIRRQPVWIAASTHEGEDELVLAAHHRLLEALPDAMLILVPRHPERFEKVAQLVRTRGLMMSRRSIPTQEETACVLLGDTMGELLMFYGAASVAFVGGSLVPHGGHNPLEPASWGLPVLCGPHTFNFADVCSRMEMAGGLARVDSAESLAEQLLDLFTRPDHLIRKGQAALQVVETNRGALDRLLRGIAEQL